MRIVGHTAESLQNDSGRRILIAEIRDCPHGFRSADGAFWMHALPDRIRSLPPVSYDRTKGAPVAENCETVLYGDYEPKRTRISPTKPCPILYFNSQSFFIPAVIPFELRNFRPISGLLVWAQIDMITALKKMIAAGYIEAPDSLRNSPRLSTYYGSVANLIGLAETGRSDSRFGLFSMVELSEAPAFELPIISAVDQNTETFPGLAELLVDNVENGEDILTQASAFQDPAQQTNFKTFEEALVNQDLKAAATVLRDRDKVSSWSHSSRAQYALGCMYESQENHGAASEAFYEAQRLDHFSGMEKLLAAQSREAKPFRDAFPEVFDMIRRGDRLQALPTLRGVVGDHPMVGNAILSYCLRGISEPAEGLAACEKSLSLNPHQTDVLGNLWSFLLELESDTEGLEIAKRHLDAFPRELPAISNAIDSSILRSDIEAAILLVHRYFICSANFPQVIKLLFKVYERAELWRELAEVFDELIPLLSGPTAETLCFHGEALIENQRFDECQAVFDQALTAEPGNSHVILGYARALARADKEEDAEQLLLTALGDQNRIDAPQDRIFLLTLLAEIQRRTGKPELALESFHRELGEKPLEASVVFGPLPGLEYAESLLILGKRTQVLEAIELLLGFWPDDPFILELAEIVGAE